LTPVQSSRILLSLVRISFFILHNLCLISGGCFNFIVFSAIRTYAIWRKNWWTFAIIMLFGFAYPMTYLVNTRTITCLTKFNVFSTKYVAAGFDYFASNGSIPGCIRISPISASKKTTL
jgi:hypothetical protein